MINTDDLIIYKCLSWTRNYQNKFDEDLKKWTVNNYKFCKHDINEFILMLWKGVYLYEYKGDWKKLSETSLTRKKFSLQ